MYCGCNKCDLCKEKSMDKRKAKLSQLKELSKEMKKMMGDGFAEGMKGMQKVTVASDSKEGLQKGLSKAQEIMKKKGLMEEMSDEEKEYKEDIDDQEEEMLEEEAEDMAESIDKMSPEEIKKKIEKLQSMLESME